MNHPRVHTQIVKVLNNSRRERYHSIIIWYNYIIYFIIFTPFLLIYIHKAIPLGIIQLNDSIMTYNLKNNFFYYRIYFKCYLDGVVILSYVVIMEGSEILFFLIFYLKNLKSLRSFVAAAAVSSL